MEGATFDGFLYADSMQVGAHLLMRSTEENQSSFKGVSLSYAKVTGYVDMDGAIFDGVLNGNSMQVGANLFMRSTEQHKATFKGVDLGSAKVTGNVFMDGATFEGDLDAQSIQVGADLFLRNAIFAQQVNMIFARIGGSLDMSGATLAEFHLSGVSIAKDLVIGGRDKSTVWLNKEGEPGSLNLHNARITSLVDAKNAWSQEISSLKVLHSPILAASQATPHPRCAAAG
jgi:uncharacterized protein YjbI with pentapeptide repeats